MRYRPPTLVLSKISYGTALSLLIKEEMRMAFEEFPRLEMCELCAPWGSLGPDKPPTRRGRRA
ncbi:hypothetical protein [Streptomyces sp. NPDC006477]|uniref:hypothetical protein n=1 Tax=Streptomyces sp. NPDC006477 TaxID=3364747 RepID=UPI0036B6D2ED